MPKEVPIKLSDILTIGEPNKYKVHFGTRGVGDEHPEEALDAFTDGRWDNWQEPWREKNRFPRDYIFTMMRFYPDRDNTIWLFGGIYAVTDRDGANYKAHITHHYENYIGKLKLKFYKKSQYPYPYLENVYDRIEVVELLRERYGGIPFKGYENVHLSFGQLNTIINNQPPDWRGALENIKGVYLITDRNKGKRYIGSAYGQSSGIWGRWRTYVKFPYHGENKEIKTLLNALGSKKIPEYVSNFTYTLLEYCPKNMDKKSVIERESYWKDILLTRNSKYGYNRN